MARVVALVPDLLFGSQVLGSLQAAGHEVELIGDGATARERLTTAAGSSAAAEPAVEVLVVDLVDPDLEGAALLEALRAEGLLARVCTLAFYSHVDASARERAKQAGFDMVVPRSRMAREPGELIATLANG